MRLILLTVLSTVLPHFAYAEIGADRLAAGRCSCVTATAEATVAVKPDVARIQIGVVTQAQTATAAAEQNARQMEQVRQQIRSELGQEADLQTSGYALMPEHRRPKEGQPATIGGYRASNMLQVTTARLDRVGALIDAVTRSGANQVHSVQFDINNPSAARAQALRQAAARARQDAEAMAAGLGVRVAGVISAVEEDTGMVRPLQVEAMALPAARTPVEPGTLDVRARVAVSLEIAR